MGAADLRSLRFDLVDAATNELPGASGLFDVSEDEFDDVFSQAKSTSVPAPPDPGTRGLNQRTAFLAARGFSCAPVRRVCRYVKRWRDAAMALRWTGAVMLDAAKGFRRLKAYRQLPILKNALVAHQAKHAGNAALEQHAAAA